MTELCEGWILENIQLQDSTSVDLLVKVER